MPEMTQRTGNQWLQTIDDVQKYRKDKLVDNVKRFLDLYKGNHWGMIGHTQRRDLITVNLIFPMIRNQIGYYYYRDPKLYVKPRKDGADIAAAIAENVLNYEWAERNVRRQMRFSIYDVLLMGNAFSEIGWRFETDVIKQKGKDERIFYSEYIKKDHPYVRRISPLRFGFDPKAEMDPLTESEFVFKETFASIDDVKKNPKFKNTKDLDAANTTNDREKDRYGETVIKLIELHDRKHMRLYVFAQGYERPLQDIPHPYEDILDGHNFEGLVFNHTPDESYGTSQVALVEDQQHELNRTRTQMFHHRRRVSNRRYVYDDGAISDTEIAKLEDAEGGSLVAVGNIDRIKPLEDARLSYDVPLIESVIKQDIRELTGLPASQFGVANNKSISATELSQIETAKNLRNDDNLVLVEEFTRNIGRKFLQVIQKFSEKEQAIQIVGPRGAFWDTWTSEDIQGEFNTLIDPGSTTKESDAIRRKQATDLMIVLKDVPGINRRRVVTDVIKTFDAQRIEEYFLPNFDQLNGAAPPQQQPSVPGVNPQAGVPTSVGIEQNSKQLGPLTK